MNVAELIEQTAGSAPAYVEPVSGGLSGVIKCKTEVNRKTYMVKVIPSDQRRDLWYTELNKHCDEQMANPKIHRLFPDGNMCLLSPWITGVSLEECLASASREQIDDYASQAADILLMLHREVFEFPPYQESLRSQLKGLCEKINEYGLIFPGKENVCDYLMKAVNEHQVRHVCFVHKDVRPENFIVHNGKLYLIDFDNGSLGERAADFPYLTTMVWPEHRLFAKKLIENYLSKADDPDFWNANLIYSTAKVADYAIWKWEVKQRQVVIQANELMKQYEGLTRTIPAWWDATV